MRADSGIQLSALKVDGGASANDFLMQTQADIIDAPVNRPKCVETTAMGAAYLAGLAVGYWSSKEEVLQNWAIDQTFKPEITEEKEANASAAGRKQSNMPTAGPGMKKINIISNKEKSNKLIK